MVINPTSANTNGTNGKYTLSLVGQTAFDDDYRLLECGFLYVTANVTNENAFVIDGKVGFKSVKKVVSVKRDEGQYMYTLTGAPKSMTVTARAYMILEKDGEQITVYSNLCDASWT